jgi:hypothetical protein
MDNMSKYVQLIGAIMVAGCSEDYPPCSPNAGAGGADTIIIVGAGPGVTAASGGDWAESNGDHGYSRNHLTGEVCTCDAEDDARRSCVAAPPAEKPAPETIAGSESDVPPSAPPGNGIDFTDPQTSHLCGEVYWCCANLHDSRESPPKDYKWKDWPVCGAESRHAAYHIWVGQILALFKVKTFTQMSPKNLFTNGPGLYDVATNCHREPIGDKHCVQFPWGS